MSVPEDLTFEELFRADGREPDSLFDRWMAGDLDPETEEAVLGHLLGSTLSRDEAMVRILVREGAVRTAVARGRLVEGLRVAVRLVRGAIEALAGSLQPLPAPAVAVRSGEMPRPGRLSFAAEPFGPSARLDLSPAGDGRFRVALDQPLPDEPSTEWALVGDAGRMVTADPEAATVLFSSVGAGAWSLERRDGELVSTSMELRLEVD